MKVNLDISTLQTVAFVVLKLTGYIAWSWLWVLAPLWIPLVLVVLVFMIWLAVK